MILKDMKIGEIRVLNAVESSINETSYRNAKGKIIKKGDLMKLSNFKGEYGEFSVDRIFGKSYLLLKEKGNKSKLSKFEKLKLFYYLSNSSF